MYKNFIRPENEVSFKPIERAWINKRWDKNEGFNIYIHNPFCIARCSYCKHKGNKIVVNSNLYKKFYEYYLPKEIKKFEKVLLSHPIDSIYFGGGTPSIMSTKTMKDIFEAIPNFKKIPVKIFEAHPALMSKSKMDLLIENNFGGGYVSFGVQSFDEEVLKSQNRIYVSPEKLKEKVEYLQKNNIKVNCDLLALINGYELKDLWLLKKDMETLSSIVHPDIIAVYPLSQAFTIEHTLLNEKNPTPRQEYKQNEFNYKFCVELRKIILDFTDRHKDYISVSKKITLEDLAIERKVELLKERYNTLFITTMEEEEFDKRHSYPLTPPPENPPHQNVLSFGAYGSNSNFFENNPYSYINSNFVYYSANREWETIYYIAENKLMNIQQDNDINSYFI